MIEEKEPEEREDAYRTLAENIPGVVYRVFVRENNRMEFFNDVLQSLTGYTSDELKVGEVHSIDPLIVADDREHVIRTLRAAMTSRQSFDVEYRLKHKDGSIRHLVEHGRPIFGPDGNISYIDGAIFDITGRKRAEEEVRRERDRAQTYLDVAGVMMLAIDAEGQVMLLNRKGCEILGCSAQEAVGKSWVDNFLPPAARDEVKAVWKSIMEGKLEQVEYHENPVLTSGGEERIMAWQNVPLKDAEGRIIGILSSGNDITERKRAEDAMRESEERYRLLFEKAPIGIGLASLDGKIVSANESMRTITGYSAEELRKINLADTYQDPADRERLLETLKRNGSVTGYEVRLKRKDGTPYDAALNVSRIRIACKDLVQTTCIDMTERKRMEQALRDNEERYRELADSITDVFFAMDKDLRYTYWNEASEDLTGISAKDAIGKSLYELFPDVKGTRAEEAYLEVLRTRQSRSFVNEYKLHDKQFFFEINAYPTKWGISVFTRDITERKRMEETLRESEERFRHAMEATSDGLWDWNVETGEVYYSPAHYQMLGYEPGELPGLARSWMDLIHPDERDGVLRSNQDCIENRIPNFKIEFRMRTRSGGWKWILGRGRASARDANGRALRMIGIHEDITERKRMEEEIRNLSQLRESIIDNANLWLDVLDEKANVLIWNKAAEAMSGYSREEVLGHGKIWEWLHPDEQYRKSITDLVADVIQHGRVEEGFETKIRRKDGQTRIISWNERNLLDEHGKVIGSIALGRDVTEQKKMEEDLQKLASVVRHSSELVNLATIDGKMIFLNEAGAKMLGIDPREVQRVNIMQVIPDHLQKKVMTELLPALMSGGTWEGDLQYRNLKTGRLTDVHATTFTIKDPTTRTPLYLTNVSLDITERKHAEEALRESEGRYRVLFDSASDAIFIHDMGGKFLEVNQVGCDRLGYSREELLQMTPADIDSPEYASQVAKRTAEIREQGHAIFKTTHIRRDGTAVPAELSSRLIEYKGKPAVLSIARDITVRLKYEEKLVALHKHASQLAGAKNIEEIIESTLNAMQIALGFDIADVFVIRDGHIESKGVRGMPLGFSGPVPDGRGIVCKAANSKATVRVGDVRTEPAYLDRFGPGWEGPPSMSSEMAVPVIVDDKTAAVLNVESTQLDVFTDEDQKLLETLAVHVGSDIRRLKSDEELRRYSAQLEELVTERTAALRAARERLEYVIASNPAVIYGGKPLADHSDFFLTYLSERVVSMLGFEPQEFVGHPEFWERHVPPEDMRSVMAEMPRLWKEGHRTFEYRFLHRDGTYRWIREEAKVVRDANGNPIEVNGYWIDISEHKHLEEALLRVERLAAIGETARMIGHDLRNPLQGISGATAVLRQHFGQRTDEITLEMLQTIDGCVKYANGIVSDLLDYTRELQLDLTKTNPRQVVNDVLSLIRLPSNIRLLDLTESKPEIVLDVEKIQRVFMNIIDNAVAAMPKGGKITIKSKVRKENLELQFTDTGEGIAKKEMKMIWKPFHTTKAKGIGLGLAICKRIVEAHAGSISVTSEVRKGTTFLIKLPIEPLLKRTKT